MGLKGKLPRNFTDYQWQLFEDYCKNIPVLSQHEIAKRLQVHVQTLRRMVLRKYNRPLSSFLKRKPGANKGSILAGRPREKISDPEWKIVEDNAIKMCTLRQIAALLNMPEAKLERLIKEKTGLDAQSYFDLKHEAARCTFQANVYDMANGDKKATNQIVTICGTKNILGWKDEKTTPPEDNKSTTKLLSGIAKLIERISDKQDKLLPIKQPTIVDGEIIVPNIQQLEHKTLSLSNNTKSDNNSTIEDNNIVRVDNNVVQELAQTESGAD